MAPLRARAEYPSLVAFTTVLSSIVTAPVPEMAPASALPFSVAPLTSFIEVFARMVP